MSRNEKFLREVCSKYNILVESLKWIPVGKCMEMQGREGGWILNDFTPIGLSTKEAADYLNECPDHFEKVDPEEILIGLDLSKEDCYVLPDPNRKIADHNPTRFWPETREIYSSKVR